MRFEIDSSHPLQEETGGVVVKLIILMLFLGAIGGGAAYFVNEDMQRTVNGFLGIGDAGKPEGAAHLARLKALARQQAQGNSEDVGERMDPPSEWHEAEEKEEVPLETVEVQITPELLVITALQKGGTEPEVAGEIRDWIFKTGEDTGLDPLFLMAFIHVRSKFNPTLEKDGNKGLFQINSSRGEYIASLSGVEWKGEEALLDASYNSRLALAYVSALNRFLKGNEEYLAIAFEIGFKEFIELAKDKKKPPRDAVNFSDIVQAEKLKFHKFLESRNAASEEETLQEQTEVSATAPIEESVERSQEKITEEAGDGGRGLLKRVDPEKVKPLLNAGPESLKTPESSVNTAKSAVERVVNRSELMLIADNLPAAKSDLEIINYLFINAGLEAPEVASKVVLWSTQLDIDPLLIAAIMQVQSGLKWDTISLDPKRLGLFQFHAADGNRIALTTNVTWAGAQELLTPAYSLRLGIKYFDALRREFENDEKAIKAILLSQQELEIFKQRGTVPEVVEKKAKNIIEFRNALQGRLKK